MKKYGWAVALIVCVLLMAAASNLLYLDNKILFGIMILCMVLAAYGAVGWRKYNQRKREEDRLRQAELLKQQEEQRVQEFLKGKAAWEAQQEKIRKRQEEDRAEREARQKEIQEEKKAEDEARKNRRAGTVLREFSVAGVSRHQDVFENAGYENDEYYMSKKELEEEFLTDVEIPRYLFGTVNLSLELDPENEYDPNAVKVFLNGEHIGYIPKEDAKYVHDMMMEDRIADVDARIVGGPYKKYDSIDEEMVKVDLFFGMRIDLYIKQGR